MFTIRSILISLFIVGAASSAWAHCQVPCGIYDDHARIHAMEEDVATIEKATLEIKKLAAKADAQSLNQATRWIATKEAHASRIITTVAEYFLTQKLKAPKDGDKSAYFNALADHHAVMRAAMKTKQTVDVANVQALKVALARLATHWPKTK